MTDPTGFEYRVAKDGRVRITHHGRMVTTLAGAAADRFLDRARIADAAARQHLMARATGNYKRGNER